MGGIDFLAVEFLRIQQEKDVDIPMPAYMTDCCSGMDIYAAVDSEVKLDPGKLDLIPTGFAIKVPDGFEAQIRPRSGLASRNGITVLNSPGTIDADYIGEVKVLLINFGVKRFIVKRGSRIAQMVISKVYRAKFDVVNRLTRTKRGTGGFGHTGI